MRRMITESDVEKLDSIKPSEMQKLAAMQDPKTAQPDQVLTADGTGKAVFKKASGGTTYGLLISDQITEEIYCDFHTITDDNPIPGFTDNFLYCDINSPGDSILDFQVLLIAAPDDSMKYLMSTLIAKGILITHPRSNLTRIFISTDNAFDLNISDGSSANVRYTYRTIKLQDF